MELKQLAKGRMTRKGYVLFGRIRLCLKRKPPSDVLQIVLIGDLCLSYVVHPTLFGPCSLGVRPLK